MHQYALIILINGEKKTPPVVKFCNLETVWGAEISRKNLRRKAAEEKVGIGGPQKKKNKILRYWKAAEKYAENF